MRFIRGARTGVLLACLPVFSIGCATLSPKLSTLPSIARNRADVQYQAAQNAEQRGQWQKARELYLPLQKNSPNNPEYSHRIGVVCTQLGDFEAARQYFEHSRGLNPNNSVLLSDMGYSAYLQKDYGRAETLLSESVQLKPDDPRAINNLAMVIGFQGRFEECLLTFRRVNNESQSLLNVAYIHSQRGETDAAIALYQRVLANDPANRVATLALKHLNSAAPASPPVASSTAVAAQTPSNSVQQTGGTVFQLTDFSNEPPAPLPPIVDEVPAAPSVDAVPVQSPVITSATELPPPQDFQAPVIVPFSSESATEIVRSAPRKLTDEPSNAEFQSPHKIFPADNPEDVKPILAQTASQTLPTDSAEVKRDQPNPKNLPANESEELTGLEWLKTELSQQADKAAQDAPATVHKDDCFRGFCPVAIRDERRLRISRDEFSVGFHGQIYRFCSAEALAQFQEHPDWYVPVAEGVDIIDLQRGHGATRGTLDYAVWFRRRLHMFSSAEHLAIFRANPREFVTNR